jgi:outer membrane protein OmpA-like peptidoglycan-associated protein
MKSRILVTLILSAVITLPAFAQQASSDSNAQQPTSAQAAPAPSAETPNLEPLQPITSRDFWDGDEPSLVNLVSHPFARKAYVKRQIDPIKDRLNELDEITKSNAATIKDIDARSQRGIQLASEKTSLADQHATDATAKADTAKLAATDATTRVSTAEQMVGNVDQYRASAQTEIRFGTGQTALSKKAKDALDDLAGMLKNQHSYVIEVQGFAPGQGQAAIAASQKIADSVVRYLVLNHEIPLYRIYVVSMGNASVAGEERHATGRRVEISLLKNDLLSSAQH